MQPEDQTLPGQPATRPPSAAAAANLPKLYRGRPWLTAAIAVLVELVVVAAVDNQTVTRTLRDPLDDPARTLADYSRGAIDAATTFWWRFAPADGQATHVWAAQFAGIGVLVLLTWLGTLAIARGSVTFGRVWIGEWALVTAAAPIAIMVRNALVTPTAPGPGQSKVGQAVYGYDEFGSAIVAGLVLGVVTGLIAAAVAISSRRHVAAAAPVERGFAEHDEYYDDSFVPRYGQPAGYQPSQQPYQPQPWGESQWATTQLPAVEPGPEPAQSQPAQSQPAQWPPAPEPPAWAAPAGPPPAPPGSHDEWTDQQPTQAIPAAAAESGTEPRPGPAPHAETEGPPRTAAAPDTASEPQPEPDHPLAPADQTQQLPRVPADPDEDTGPTPIR